MKSFKLGMVGTSHTRTVTERERERESERHRNNERDIQTDEA